MKIVYLIPLIGACIFALVGLLFILSRMSSKEKKNVYQDKNYY